MVRCGIYVEFVCGAEVRCSVLSGDGDGDR